MLAYLMTLTTNNTRLCCTYIIKHFIKMCNNETISSLYFNIKIMEWRYQITDNILPAQRGQLQGIEVNEVILRVYFVDGQVVHLTFQGVTGSVVARGEDRGPASRPCVRGKRKKNGKTLCKEIWKTKRYFAEWTVGKLEYFIQFNFYDLIWINYTVFGCIILALKAIIDYRTWESLRSHWKNVYNLCYDFMVLQMMLWDPKYNISHEFIAGDWKAQC